MQNNFFFLLINRITNFSTFELIKLSIELIKKDGSTISSKQFLFNILSKAMQQFLDSIKCNFSKR